MVISTSEEESVMKKTACVVLLILFWWIEPLSAQEKYIASYAGFAGFQAPFVVGQGFRLPVKVWRQHRSRNDSRLRAWSAGAAWRQHPFRPNRWDSADCRDQSRCGSMKQKNPAVVEETYQFFAKTFSSPPRMSHEGIALPSTCSSSARRKPNSIPISAGTSTNA